jgi:hypothetical protein
MQIALVAVVLLAGMWFTVLKPKPATDTAAVAPVAAAPAPATSEPVAPGVKGLTSAIDKAKAASATSDAANAKIQKATGSGPAPASPAAAAKPATPAKPAVAKATPTASKGVKRATPAKAKAKAKSTSAVKTGAKAAAPVAAKTKPAAAAPSTAASKTAAHVDPSDRLLAYLAKGKTLVILFHGAGADDNAARKAVHRTALADPKHVVSAYIPIGDVGKYEAITSDVQILSAPSILVIGTDGKATLLTGYVDAAVVRQTVGDARREAAAAAKTKSK